MQEAGPRFCEIGSLRRCRNAPEKRVALRETPVSRDDLTVAHRIIQIHLVAMRLEKLHRKILIGQIFRMFERHVEEMPAAVVHLLVRTGLQRQPRFPPGNPVDGKGHRRGAVHVAGKLIEHDDGCQPGLGARPPFRRDLA